MGKPTLSWCWAMSARRRGCWVRDEQAEDPPARGQRADGLMHGWVDPHGDELHKGGVFLVQNTERAVTSPHHRAGLLHEVSQQSRQAEVCLEEEDRFK